jgi:hypothetical protein
MAARICSNCHATSRAVFALSSEMTVKCALPAVAHGRSAGAAARDTEGEGNDERNTAHGTPPMNVEWAPPDAIR